MSYAKLGMAAFGAAAAYGLSRGRGRRSSYTVDTAGSVDYAGHDRNAPGTYRVEFWDGTEIFVVSSYTEAVDRGDAVETAVGVWEERVVPNLEGAPAGWEPSEKDVTSVTKVGGSSARGRRVMAAGSSRRKKTEKVPADTGYSRKGKFQAEYGMNFLRGNREPYFSITGTGYAPNGREVSGGQLHGMVRRYFPKLRPLIKWHLFSPSSGPMHYRPNAKYWAREGHKAHFKSTVVWGALPSDKSADVGKIMSKDPAALDRWLKLRLPKLRAGFKRDMKAAGISWD